MVRFALPLLGAVVGLGLLGVAQETPKGNTPAPRTVSIDKDITLPAALAELRKQTGARVLDETDLKDKTFALKLKEVTFWQALDGIARAAGARVALGNGGRPLALVRAAATDRVPPTSYSGDFRVRLPKIAATRELDSDRSALTATLEIAWAPAVMPLFLDTQVRDLRVVGGDGKALKLENDGSSLAAIDGRGHTTLDLALPGVPRSMQDLASVEGKLLVVAPSKMLTFRFDADLKTLQGALADGALRRLVQEEVTCRIAKVVAEKDRWSVQVALDYPRGGRTLESFQAGSLVANNELVLVSRDGKRRLARTGYVIDSVSSRRALVTYHFRDAPGRRLGAPGDWRPVYTAPARIVDVTVPFTFKKVPLP
jgi:hypothetical protein